jgi:hypothetical protein
MGTMKLADEEQLTCRACLSVGWSEATAEDFEKDSSFSVRKHQALPEKFNYNTVSVQMTQSGDNLTDLLHVFLSMAFVSGLSEREVVENVKRAAEEQYLQAILNAEVSNTP